jgi:hypothetical protein
LGSATGTLGVAVGGGSGVLEGKDVGIGVSVDKICVTAGVTKPRVGVAVGGTLDGKLQADSTRTKASADNKTRILIVSLLYFKFDRLSVTYPSFALSKNFPSFE